MGRTIVRGGVRLNLKKRVTRSLSSTINTIYIGLILLFIIIIGGIFVTAAGQQVEQNVEETMDSLMAQRTDQLSDTYQDLFEKFYALTKSTSSRTLLSQNNPSSETYLMFSEEVEDFYYRNATLIDSIYINFHDSSEVIFSEQQTIEKRDQVQSLFHPDVPKKEGYFWLNAHTDPLFSRHQTVQSMIYYEPSDALEPDSVFVVNLKSAYIDSILTELSMDGSYMMLLSPDGLYVPEAKDMNNELNHKVYNFYQEGNTEELSNMKSLDGHYIRNEKIGTNKWELVLVTPFQKAFSADDNRYVLLLLLVVLIGTIVFIIQIIRKYISKPIEELVIKMETTESYDEKISPAQNVPEELSILYETFNNLSDRNTRLVEQMENEQEEKLELELALLHAQISPHFLYNTLYSIKGLVDMDMKDEASEMILNLSDFLRTSLSRGKEVITIKEELKNIRSYLYMMNMRYGDYFDYEIDIPEELWSYQIVKLTLQPLVENAIYHGVMNSREKGFITIGSEVEDDAIIIYVEDNGKGMTPEKLHKIQDELAVPYLNSTREEAGIGLRSVDVRVKNRYGVGYGLDISSVENLYTKMSVKLPKIGGGNDEIV